VPPLSSRIGLSLAGLAILAIAGTITANTLFKQSDARHRAEVLTNGDATRGRDLFISKGCGGCHTLAGVAQANGLVGPPLDGIAIRATIAGKLENTPANLGHWISAPQSVVPGNAMPDVPMTAEESRDIAAFLYTRS
jgi:cytochrome c